MRKRTALTVLAGVGLSTFPAVVSALTVGDVGSSLGLTTSDLKETVINIVNWVLGLLGLVAVIMVLWGGFTWLTAAGNEEKVAKAKDIISAAVIGIVIILLAWAIVNFVLSTTTNVSTT